jgi:hopanoid biosynthesis associated protein HpnK
VTSRPPQNPPAKRLIVNADDFGMTEGVNRGILDSHQHGIVTSTTLLATGAAFESAVAAGREHPRLGIGVHLNLSEGRPVSLPAEIPSLVNSQGQLHLTPGKLCFAILTGRVRIAEIETELRAQITKVMNAGIIPTHVDGHMHVHVLPGVSKAVVNVAQEFHIPAVRCPVEPTTALRATKARNESLTKRRLISLAVSANALKLRHLVRNAGLVYPAHFYGIFATGYLDTQAIAQILQAVPASADPSELMCHPGYIDAALADTGGELQHQRETERAALTSSETLRELSTKSIALVTYRELIEPRRATI